MAKKRWPVLIGLMVIGIVLAACGGGAAEADRIAELEAQLAEAQAGGATEEELADLQAQLEEAQTAAEGARCTYNVYRLGWVMDYADANNIVNEVFGPTSDFQYSFWGSTYPDEAATFEGLVDEALLDTDMESRAATWQQAEKILLDDTVMVMPIWHYDRFGLMRADFNYFFPPFGAPKMGMWSSNSGDTTLVFPLSQPLRSMDIQASTDTTTSTVLYQMIDAPYRFNVEGGIEPMAATSYEVSEDGRTYTIHLREGAVWSDGVPVTAQHYVDGITRLLSPDMANEYAYIMFPVEGAEEYNAGELETLDSVRAVDDLTFEVTLKDALSYFDSILAFSTMHPVRLDVVEEFGEAWTEPGNFVSNGAYVLVEHSPGERVVMEKNPLYWDADNVQIERIEMPIIDEPATSLAAFENGETDSTVEPQQPAEDLPRLVDTPDFTIVPQPGTWYLAFNTVNGPTADINFRKALSSSVDRRAILDDVLQMPWRQEAYSVIPPEIAGHQGDAVGWKLDLDAAQEYLQAYMDANGITDPAEISIELWYNRGGTTTPSTAEAVEAQWEENLGIDVRGVEMEFGVYQDVLQQCNAIGGGGFRQ